MMEQYEKDKEIERLNKDVSRLEELLSVSETQYASVEQIVARLQEQLKEANEALKYFAETTIGHKRKDGTYGMWLCSGEVAWNNPLERIKTRMDYICYDPRPAKRYLKKWGVK